MKKFLLSGIALIALGGAASAADLAVKAPYPAPAIPVWSGFYVGANAGGTWAASNGFTTVGAPVFAAPTFAAEANIAAALATTQVGLNNTASFIGGGQIGYNYQFSSLVAGIEADIQGIAHSNNANIVSSAATVPGFPTETITSTTTASRSVDYLGTVRGRLGVLATPSLLAYGTAGLAYGKVNATTTITQSDCCIGGPGGVTANYGTVGTVSSTRTGWAAGGGLEWMFVPNWTARAEYLYYDLGSVTAAFPNLVANAPTFPPPTWIAAVQQSSLRINGNIVRVGLNYKFGGPVMAAY
jgi:outer membrane immunogenic protein